MQHSFYLTALSHEVFLTFWNITGITEFDEALVKKLIEKITVFANHFTVEFKSGIKIEIEA